MKLTIILLGLIAVTALPGCGENYQGRYKASSEHSEVNFELKWSEAEFMDIGEHYVQTAGERHEVSFETVQRNGSKYLQMRDKEGDLKEFEIVNHNQLKPTEPLFGQYAITYTRVDD